jgi:ADP-ribose pyrophosphatase YjhB (NUDIX family)
VVWIDGRLIVAEQVCRGRTELSLPGGEVADCESVIDALKREVAEETGLEVTPDRLLYVSEIAQPAITYDLELIFLAEARGVPRLNRFKAIDLGDGERPVMRPSLLDQITRDAASGWRDTPRWLGTLRRSPASAE